MITLKLDKSKIKIREYPYSLQVPVNMGIGAQIIEMANGAKHGLILEIKKYFPKRSKEANKHMWALCSDIAAELSKEFKTTKEDVYRKALQEGNEYQDVDVPNDMIAERMRMWASKGTGWISEELWPAHEEGKTVVRQYFGSSSFNSKQMYQLIRRLKDDAENIGLEITDPSIIALLDDGERQ